MGGVATVAFVLPGPRCAKSLDRPPPARAPLLGGGPARRQPVQPQSAQAKPVTGLDKLRGLSHGGLTVSHGLPQCQDPWLKPR